MYSHGRLLLPGGEGMGVGCPYLAPPGRERGGGLSLPLRGLHARVRPLHLGRTLPRAAREREREESGRRALLCTTGAREEASWVREREEDQGSLPERRRRPARSPS
jgi:hypothetical protein